jgi:hypothetical protein
MSHAETLIGIIHDTGTDEKIFPANSFPVGIRPTMDSSTPKIIDPIKIGSESP